MIPLREQELIRQRFAEHLAATVRLDHVTQSGVDLLAPGREPCPTCPNARTLVHELAALSDRLRLTEHHIGDAGAARLGIDRVPATVVRGPNNRPLAFYGLPAGNQFPGFLEAIIAASHGGFDEGRNGLALGTATKQRLRRLQEDVHIVVLVAPTCPYSPRMALLAFALGTESHRVRVEIVEVEEFPRLAQRYNIAGVPTTVLNDDVVVTGAVDEAALVDQVFRTARAHGRAGGGLRSPYMTPIEAPAAPSGQRQERRTPGGLILPS